MTLGERIKDLRQKHGLSREQLADKLNVPGQTVQKWESGVNEPNIETIERIARYFGVDYNYLLDYNASGPAFAKQNAGGAGIDKYRNQTILYIVLLIFSGVLILVLFIWSLLDPIRYSWSGEGFYNWYIPFYWDTATVAIFQILNVTGVAGIVFSVLKISKGTDYTQVRRKTDNL